MNEVISLTMKYLMLCVTVGLINLMMIRIVKMMRTIKRTMLVRRRVMMTHIMVHANDNVENKMKMLMRVLVMIMKVWLSMAVEMQSIVITVFSRFTTLRGSRRALEFYVPCIQIISFNIII